MKLLKADLAAKRMFQFLIGTLQTCTIRSSLFLRVSVSIPYRYATNLNLMNLNLPALQVSIPYRYATNYGGEVIKLFRPGEFQFLIGTLQTSISKNLPSWIYSFNSLEVRYKLATF